jgi:hypothetical protein
MREKARRPKAGVSSCFWYKLIIRNISYRSMKEKVKIKKTCGKSHRDDSSGINDEGVSGDLLFARAVITLPQLIFFHLL